MKLLRWSAGVILLSLMQISFANTSPASNSASSVIEGSYIVTFKDPVGDEKPFITPPDYSLKDQPGFVPPPYILIPNLKKLRIPD